MITSKFLLSVISLKFKNAVNGKGKAKTDKASPPELTFVAKAIQGNLSYCLVLNLFNQVKAASVSIETSCILSYLIQKISMRFLQTPDDTEICRHDLQLYKE